MPRRFFAHVFESRDTNRIEYQLIDGLSGIIRVAFYLFLLLSACRPGEKIPAPATHSGILPRSAWSWCSVGSRLDFQNVILMLSPTHPVELLNLLRYFPSTAKPIGIRVEIAEG